MRELALQVLSRCGLASLARRVISRRGRFVVELHGVPHLSDEELEALPPDLRPHVTLEDLRSILEWIGDQFRWLDPEEFLHGETPGALLTFDDGFANQARAVPVLEAFEVPALLFVTTSHVADSRDWLPFVRQRLEGREKAAPEALLHELFDGMTTEELRECAASPRVTIGSHTVSHPRLDLCDEEKLRLELEESKAFLKRHSGQEVDLLAYPFGRYEARVARTARDVGYKAAFVEESGGLGLGVFEIPRIGLYRSDAAYLDVKLSGLHRRPLGVAEGPS